ncbi:MAG TPA: amylo-alpha-1,6-glucosidase [Ktedonobacteraceae bacterium]|nr:amylo-alpha-1,6-glucosidase [Ktedonobacteraceae bacterium]
MPGNAWNLSLEKDVCSDVTAGLDREWLVTNGLGGYASGSILGATTRSYHGLLVAALRPPVERVVLVAKTDEEVALPGGQSIRLGVNEYEDGTIDPQGQTYLASFALEGDIPCFTYQLTPELRLEKRIWMEYGENTTYVQYLLRDSADLEETQQTPVLLTILPFCLYRDYHSVTRGQSDWRFLVDSLGNGCQVRAHADAVPYRLWMGREAMFTPTGLWYWHVRHRQDQARGLNSVEDVYQPGSLRVPLRPGVRTTLVISAEQQSAPTLGGPGHEEYVAQALRRHQRRIKQLLDIADRSTTNLAKRDPVHARLVLAADQFIVTRPQATERATGKTHLSPDSKTIIAGYPWFTDWGRDSMIALPGLLLCTGRYSEARGLFKAFLSYAHQGLIPNRFPDRGEAPEYNTADATLWLFSALHQYLTVTNDRSLLKELFPRLVEMIQWHQQGTDFGIGMDPEDGLLRASAPGLQLTWMDAKIGEWVVTPRRGKPVEVNALWYCALACMEKWAMDLSIDAFQYGQLRSRVEESFTRRFWYAEGGYLYDVVDVDGISGQNDASLRPNQLLAASLSYHLLSQAQARSILEQVTAHLLTPPGLRTLSPQDPQYHAKFNGDPLQRDSAYHQGTVWPWLLGPYIDVHMRLHHDCAAVLPLLTPLVRHLWDACLGTISEVAEPEYPFKPGGCFAQAWSVAEFLRIWLMLE